VSSAQAVREREAVKRYPRTNYAHDRVGRAPSLANEPHASAKHGGQMIAIRGSRSFVKDSAILPTPHYNQKQPRFTWLTTI
jgi:hypothetical protein